jgi:scyllo-inositol 2-dehydrogenase (NAD+)
MDAGEVFGDPDIDAVVIATPTPTHAALIVQAAQSGKHIFVEKPLTLNPDEADDVLRVVREHKVACQVGFMRRFDPAFVEAKKRIARGDIGRPIYYKGVSRDPYSPPAEFIRASGGMFADMMIHDFDMARFLLASEATSVSAHGSVLVHPFMRKLGDVDQAVAYVTFASGAAGDMEASRNAKYGYDIRVEIMGTEGTIAVGSLKYHDLQIWTPQGSTHDIVPHFPEKFRDAYLLEMIHFIDCVRNGERPSVTEEDGKAALQIAVAARRSFESGRTVSLSAEAGESKEPR